MSTSNLKKTDSNWLGLPLSTFLSRKCSLCKSLITFLYKDSKKFLTSTWTAFLISDLSIIFISFYVSTSGLMATSSWCRESLSFIRSYCFLEYQAVKVQLSSLSYKLLNWEAHISVVRERLNFIYMLHHLYSFIHQGILKVISISWLL